jgi:peroxiredoxin 3
MKNLLKKINFFFLKASSLAAARVQHPAPNFEGQAVVEGDFKKIQLSDFKGKYLVLFFYPLDLYV